MKLLSASLHNLKIEKQRDLTEEEELEVVRREVRKRRDAIEAYKKVGAKERVEKESQELKILQEFLPEDLSDDELLKIVKETIKKQGIKSIEEMGKVIGGVMAQVKGRADGKRVAELVRKELSQS